MSAREKESRSGIDRRAFLRRAAATGAAVAWAAPVVKTLAGTPALAQTGTPKDFSYVAVCFTCDGGETRCCVKFDLDTGACEHGTSINTPQCSPGELTGDRCEDPCSLVSISGDTKTVVLSLPAEGACAFVEGVGVGKCGNPENPESGGECVTPVFSDGNRTATFDLCGV